MVFEEHGGQSAWVQKIEYPNRFCFIVGLLLFRFVIVSYLLATYIPKKASSSSDGLPSCSDTCQVTDEAECT
jgi:hypothetical protein